MTKKECVVLGLPRCGTSSLRAYFRGRNKTCYWKESIFDSTAIKWYEKNHLGAKIYIIVRDASERLWSAFHFFKYSRRGYSFREFLYLHDPKRLHQIGNIPLYDADLTSSLKPFLKYKPRIIKLDQVIKFCNDFPKITRHDELLDAVYNMPVPDCERNFIHGFLEIRDCDKYGLPTDKEFWN